MSKRAITMRHSAIIEKLSKYPASFKEILKHLERQSEITGYKLTVTDRTFKRDKDEILSLYQIEIHYNQSTRKYEILENNDERFGNRMLSAIGTVSMLNSSMEYARFIDFQPSDSRGNDHFYDILHSIKNSTLIDIVYKPYWQEVAINKFVEPYLLKEFLNRWYLVGKNEKGLIRIYGLDRIHRVTSTKKKFQHPPEHEIKGHFKNNFGIIAGDSGSEIERVILSFNAYQGKYIKSLPLHSSQRIISDNEDELIISLDIYVTYDFEMQLLSYGEDVKIIEPKSLVDGIKYRLMQALDNYK